MKINHTHVINYFEIDPTYKIKSSVLFQQLQNAAVLHSERAGYRMDSLIQKGWGWVLNKMDMEIYRYPEYKEKLEIFTWSRGIKGVKAKREFQIFSGNEKLVAASSIWVFVDSKRMKIIKAPEQMNDKYTVNPDVGLNEKLEFWRARKDISLEFEYSISTRLCDYDPMGHVNNTIYIDFLETAVNRMAGKQPRLFALKIQYFKEIDPSTSEVNVGIHKTEDSHFFNISDNENLYAAGEMALAQES